MQNTKMEVSLKHLPCSYSFARRAGFTSSKNWGTFVKNSVSGSLKYNQTQPAIQEPKKRGNTMRRTVLCGGGGGGGMSGLSTRLGDTAIRRTKIVGILLEASLSIMLNCEWFCRHCKMPPMNDEMTRRLR